MKNFMHSVSFKVLVLFCLLSDFSIAQMAQASFTFNYVSGGSVSFTSTSTNTVGLTHRWMFGDGNQAVGPQTVVHTYSAMGTYATVLILESPNSVIRDSTTQAVYITDPTTRVNEVKQASTLRLFPQPADDQLIIKAEEGLPDGSLFVYDQAGRLLRTQSVRSGEPLILDTRQFESGLYQLRLVSDDGTVRAGSFVVR